MAHRYKLGDHVALNFGFLDQSGSGRYEVVRLVPPEADGEPQYRVKGEDGLQRVIGERQILDASRAERD